MKAAPNWTPWLWVFLIQAVAAAGSGEHQPIPIAPPPRAGVDFIRDVQPALKANCLACHNRASAKAGLNLETRESMLRGGDSGPAIIPKRGDRSLLLKAASHRSEPYMPPKGNKANAINLTPQELAFIKAWIDAGAKEGSGGIPAVEWQPLPPSVQPVLAAALTGDGAMAACGRGNRLSVYWLHAGRELEVADSSSRAIDPGPRPVTGVHRDLINALAFSPDGEWLASGGFREIKLWQRTAPRTVRVMRYGGSWRRTLATSSSDGRKLVLAGGGGIEILNLDSDAENRRALIVARGRSLDYSGAALSPSQRWLASLSQEGSLVVRQLPANPSSGPAGEVRAAIQTVPEHLLQWIGEDVLALAGETHGIRFVAIRETGSNPVLETLRREPFPGVEVLALAASRQQTNQTSARLLALGNDGALRIMPGSEGGEVRKIDVGKQAARVFCSQDGAHAVVIDRHGAARLWDLESSQAKAELAVEKAANDILTQSQQHRDVAVALSEHAKKSLANAETARTNAAARAAKAKTAHETAVQKAAEKLKALEAAQALPSTGDGAAESKQKVDAAAAELETARRVAGAAAHELELADKASTNAEAAVKQARTELEAAQQLASLSEGQLRNYQVQAESMRFRSVQGVFSLDGSLVAMLGIDGKTQLWQVDSGIALGAIPGGAVCESLLGFDSIGRLLIGAEDGQLLATELNPSWRLRSTLGGMATTSGSPIQDRVTALAFSSDGRRLAAGGGEPSRGGEVLIFDVDSGRLSSVWTNLHSDAVLSIAWSPGDRWLASGGADRFARLIEGDSGKMLKTFEGHTHHVLAVAWRRDGRVLATGGADGAIKLWDPQSGERLKNIGGSEKEVSGLAFAGATGQLLAAFADSKVRLIKEEGGDARVYEGSQGYLHCLAGDLHGNAFVAGSADGSLRLWRLTEARVGKILDMPH